VYKFLEGAPKYNKNITFVYFVQQSATLRYTKTKLRKLLLHKKRFHGRLGWPSKFVAKESVVGKYFRQ
jgi:hypothetical protein